MKKSVFLAAFGLAYSVASSYGQGYVHFSSYAANNGGGATTSDRFTGQLAGPNFTAELYYALGTVSDPVNFYSYSSIRSPVSSALTLLQGVSAQFDNYGFPADFGYFDDGVAVIPGYSGGPITFEVVAFYGVSYAYSTSSGRSGSFTMDFIAGSVNTPPSFFGDNGQPMPNFFVTSEPEPSTLALAGLGGLVSLVMFRRRHQ